MANELLETGQAALVLRVSPFRVRQLADAGTLPVALVTARGRRLFDPPPSSNYGASVSARGECGTRASRRRSGGRRRNAPGPLSPACPSALENRMKGTFAYSLLTRNTSTLEARAVRASTETALGRVGWPWSAAEPTARRPRDPRGTRPVTRYIALLRDPAPLSGRCPACEGVTDETGCRLGDHFIVKPAARVRPDRGRRAASREGARRASGGADRVRGYNLLANILTAVGGLLLFGGLWTAFLSNRYQSQAISATKVSTDPWERLRDERWYQKWLLQVRSDRWFRIGIVLTALGIILQAAGSMLPR